MTNPKLNQSSSKIRKKFSIRKWTSGNNQRFSTHSAQPNLRQFQVWLLSLKQIPKILTRRKRTQRKRKQVKTHLPKLKVNKQFQCFSFKAYHSTKPTKNGITIKLYQALPSQIADFDVSQFVKPK